MNARPLLLVTAIVAITATPVLSFAGETAAMNACVNAFVSANLPKEQKVRVRQMPAFTSPLAWPSRSYEIALTARGAHSGRQIAKATCVADADGSVTALNGRPVASTLAAAKMTLSDR